jgi:hypothetical protein
MVFLRAYYMWLNVSNRTLAGDVSLPVVHGSKGFAAGSIVGEAMGYNLREIAYMIISIYYRKVSVVTARCAGVHTACDRAEDHEHQPRQHLENTPFRWSNTN